MEIERDGLVFSDDKSRLEIDRVHAWIASTYWAKGIPRAVLVRAIDGSDCFGIYSTTGQIAFARLVTDRATFAYLCDVYVADEYRGQGIGSWLLKQIDAQPDYQGLRRWMLATRDAHAMYAQHGWAQVTDAAPLMQKHDPGIYIRNSTD